MPFVQSAKTRIKAAPWGKPLVEFVRERRLQASIRRALRSPLPEMVNIELTNECNLRCAKCPTYEAVRARGMMDPELFEKIMRDIALAKAPTSLALNGGGEALLHSNFVEFVRRARSIPNIRMVGFATNGLGLDPSLSARLLEAGLTSLKISLDTVDAKTYLAFNRVDGYEQVVRNVKEFCRLKRKGGYQCQTTLKVTLYKQDEQLLARIRQLWLGEVDAIRVTGLHNWAGLRGQRSGGLRTQPCDLLWSQVQILWNGQITLCCFDSMEGFYNMGNIRELNLSDYWLHNRGFMEVRAAHLRRDFSGLKVCATCNQDQYVTQYFYD